MEITCGLQLITCTQPYIQSHRRRPSWSATAFMGDPTRLTLLPSYLGMGEYSHHPHTLEDFPNWLPFLKHSSSSHWRGQARVSTSPGTIVTCSNAGRFQEADVLTSRGKERSVSYWRNPSMCNRTSKMQGQIGQATSKAFDWCWVNFVFWHTSSYLFCSRLERGRLHLTKSHCFSSQLPTWKNIRAQRDH